MYLSQIGSKMYRGGTWLNLRPFVKFHTWTWRERLKITRFHGRRIDFSWSFSKKNWKKSLWLFNSQCPDCDTFSSENNFFLTFLEASVEKNIKKTRQKNVVSQSEHWNAQKISSSSLLKLQKKVKKVKFPWNFRVPRTTRGNWSKTRLFSWHDGL